MALRDIVGALRDEEFWRDIARNTRAMGELGIEFGEGAVGEVAGGITGLGKLATGSSFKEAGETMENVQDWAGSFYEPKYQETEDYMQSIGEAVQPLITEIDSGATWVEDKTGGWIPRELTKGMLQLMAEVGPVGLIPKRFAPYLLDDSYGTNLGATANALRTTGKSYKSQYGIPKSQVTVKEPIRSKYPGIYDRPDEIAKQAAENTALENPALKELFGVTRQDLYEMNLAKIGNESPNIKIPKNPKGAESAKKVITSKNEQRILDVLEEAEKYPELHVGMDSWYEMQPAFDRLKEISDNPVQDYNDFNVFTGMSSPGSDVLTEINRGTGANYLNKQGRFDDFVNYAGTAEPNRTPDFPLDMKGIGGHPYHKTAQIPAMSNYLRTGKVDMDSVKVPIYIQSSGVKDTGFQTEMPVGDAHFSRSIGLADTRKNKDYAKSISSPELQTINNWWKEKIAEPLGLNSVNAQGRAWGAFAPQTGVSTPVGAPKLELLAEKIMETARAYNISPDKARDMILMGNIYAPNINLLK
tara:strand:- start:233 stop:1816 length:1584 start_codon:yes stop_codon:yes gene_type:complete